VKLLVSQLVMTGLGFLPPLLFIPGSAQHASRVCEFVSVWMCVSECVRVRV
jgi:hypothetical protein